jgi:hypothetical protein
MTPASTTTAWPGPHDVDSRCAPAFPTTGRAKCTVLGGKKGLHSSPRSPTRTGAFIHFRLLHFRTLILDLFTYYNSVGFIYSSLAHCKSKSSMWSAFFLTSRMIGRDHGAWSHSEPSHSRASSSTMEEDHAPRRRRPCTPSCFSERYRHPAAVVEEHNHRVKQMPAAPMHPDSSPSCSLWLLRSPPHKKPGDGGGAGTRAASGAHRAQHLHRAPHPQLPPQVPHVAPLLHASIVDELTQE